MVIKAIEDAGVAAGANGLNVTLDAQPVPDIKSITPAVKVAVPAALSDPCTAGRGSSNGTVSGN